MFCTNCGTKVVEGSAHCTSCGTRVEGVGTAAAIVSNAARAAYANLDEDFRKSLFLGLGAIFASIVALFTVKTVILPILLIPATMALGIMAMNSGRDLQNKAGYYLGVIGLTVGSSMLYLGLFAYGAAMAVQEVKQNMMNSIF